MNLKTPDQIQNRQIQTPDQSQNRQIQIGELTNNPGQENVEFHRASVCLEEIAAEVRKENGTDSKEQSD